MNPLDHEFCLEEERFFQCMNVDILNFHGKMPANRQRSQEAVIAAGLRAVFNENLKCLHSYIENTCSLLTRIRGLEESYKTSARGVRVQIMVNSAIL